jgi:hypothetical protein
MSSSTNKIILFAMLGIFYVIFFVATASVYLGTFPLSLKKGAILFTAAAVFSLFFVGFLKLMDFKPEGFEYCPSPGAKLCRGGPYMWQGDSEIAKYCRDLATTEEGKTEIDSYECGTGFNGMPGCGFKDTPMSNNCWQNEMCNDLSDGCLIRPNGIF